MVVGSHHELVVTKELVSRGGGVVEGVEVKLGFWGLLGGVGVLVLLVLCFIRL